MKAIDVIQRTVKAHGMLEEIEKKGASKGKVTFVYNTLSKQADKLSKMVWLKDDFGLAITDLQKDVKTSKDKVLIQDTKGHIEILKVVKKAMEKILNA